MNHLDDCTHAIVRKADGYVLNVIVADHDPELLRLLNEAHEGDTEIISCCEHGAAFVGGTWNGTHFRPYQPFPSWNWSDVNNQWEAPVGMPTDGFWNWDEAGLQWVAIPAPDEGAV